MTKTEGKQYKTEGTACIICHVSSYVTVENVSVFSLMECNPKLQAIDSDPSFISQHMKNALNASSQIFIAENDEIIDIGIIGF